MNWLTGGKHPEAKRLISQLADTTKREHAVQELIRLGADSLPVMIAALQTDDLSLLTVYQQVLARIAFASPALTKTLATAPPILRGRVAETLALRKDPDTVPALLRALIDEFPTVRAHAARALGEIGHPDALLPLLRALKDRDDEVRIAACLALGKFKNTSTFDEITVLLHDDPKIEVRKAAARTLGDMGHPAALPYLLEALHDSFWWYERESAAGDLLSAIERMGSAAVEPLIEALQDKEGTIRKFAAALLGRLGDQRAIEPLGMALYDLHHDVGRTSAEALARFGAPAVGILMEGMRHPEIGIRIHSIIALSKVKDPRVAPALLEMLDDPEAEVKKEVIRSLGEQGDARAAPALKMILSNRADREFHALTRDAIAKLA